MVAAFGADYLLDGYGLHAFVSFGLGLDKFGDFVE